MSITDELRAWAKEHLSRNSILAIADRIDAEHEEACRDEYNKGYNDGFDSGFATADDWLADNEDAMAELGWVRLPKDANGEYIHIGDVMEGYGKTIEVVELRHGRSGWVLISRDGNGYADTFAFVHHHEPTVEDVLREMMQNAACQFHDDGSCEMGLTDEQLAKYAQRLQLKEDA